MVQKSNTVSWIKFTKLNLAFYSIVIVFILVLGYKNYLHTPNSIQQVTDTFKLAVNDNVFPNPNTLLENYGTSKNVADITVVIFWILVGIVLYFVFMILKDFYDKFSKLNAESKYIFPSYASKNKYLLTESASYLARIMAIVILIVLSNFLIKYLIPISVNSISNVSVKNYLILILLLIGLMHTITVCARIGLNKPFRNY